uniref:Chalcone isomerase domain-containing protein n=1 Tax=Pseudo-nitzschia delicatissima TaxID=44447 RepID=A0A7S0TBA6_9STRA|mmetsp:Transcript_1758/g.4101  ORF Transcript_1758/g.4101 Transcript_1758/m.4101 type:complete len:297 (+) Transcript_1758:357-1247(+)
MKFIVPSSRSLLLSSFGQSPVASSRWARAAQHQHQKLHPGSRFANKGFSRRALSAATASSSHQEASRKTCLVAMTWMIAVVIDYNNRTTSGVLSVGSLSCDKVCACDRRIPGSGDVLSVGKITKEPATSISFPALCNAMSLAGVGVRVKYVFVNVYAVGAYFDPIAMMAVKKGTQADVEKALCDPTYPRTIRIVMNRGLSVDKFIAAMNEAIEPRLNGKNLETLGEFKEIFPKVDLVEGDEIELTIRGDTLLLKTGLGVGSIRSRPFTEAMCDVYFGKDPVSPTLLKDVLDGVRKL